MARNRKRERAFPVGIFILMGLFLLVGGILWIRNITQKPVYTFDVAYVNPSRVQNGLPVYFRGVQVGRVDGMDLTEDQQFSLVTIAITRKDLKLPRDAEIKIQLEGITGQRYVNIRTEDSSPDKDEMAYIQDGDVIPGKEDVTLEKLQEQLARIADNRTLEKILTKTDQTLSELTIASKQLNNFIAVNQAEAAASIRQFNRTTIAIEGAANNFSGVSTETQLAVRNFNRQMEGADDAFAALSNAGNSFSSTSDEFRTQLNQSQLLPNLSSAASELSAGVRSVSGDVHSTSSSLQGAAGHIGTAAGQFGSASGQVGTAAGHVGATTAELRGIPSGRPTSVNEVNELLDSLDRAGKQLEDNLKDIRKRNGDPALDQSMGQLQTLAKGVRDTAESGKLDPKKVTPAQTAAQLQLLQTIGLRITASTSQLQPTLIDRMNQLSAGDERRKTTGNLLQTVQSLNLIGTSLADKAGTLAPQATAQAQQPPARIGGIAATLVQIRQTAARFDCVAKQASGLLDQRFLGFKLFFGKAGKDKNNCEQFDVFQQ